MSEPTQMENGNADLGYVNKKNRKLFMDSKGSETWLCSV